MGVYFCPWDQRKRHHRKKIIISPTPANGPYWIASQSRLLARGGYVKTTYLLQHQFPIYPHSRLAVLLAVFPKPAAHITHLLQTIATVQQVLDVLGHDFRHVFQFIVEFVQVGGGTSVHVGLLCALDEGVEFDKGIWSQSGGMDLLQRIDGGEFLCEVGQVCEGELAGIRAVADAEKANRLLYCVAIPL